MTTFSPDLQTRYVYDSANRNVPRLQHIADAPAHPDSATFLTLCGIVVDTRYPGAIMLIPVCGVCLARWTAEQRKLGNIPSISSPKEMEEFAGAQFKAMRDVATKTGILIK